MMDIYNWVVAHWADALVIALAVVGGASVAVRAIAPFTKNTKDDKLAGLLEKVESWLNKLALNK